MAGTVKRVVADGLPSKMARVALDQARTAIRRLQRDAARNFWSIGRRLAQVSELELHRARGFIRIEDWASAELGLARSATFQYMRVAQAFSEEIAGTFGVEKLDRALAYIAGTPDKETARDIPSLRIPVAPVDGKPRSKPFAEVTVAELRAATRAPAARKSKPGGKPVDQPALLARANLAIDRAVGSAAAGGAEVAIRRNSRSALIDIRGVPLERAGTALRAVATALG